MHYPNKKYKLMVVGVSVSIFIISLTQTAFCVADSSEPNWPAFLAFLTGWLGIYGAGVSWAANPCLLFAWVMMVKRPKYAAIASFIALLLALLFLAFKRIMIDEAGHMGDIVGLAPGYYLWVSSMLISFIGAIIFWRIENQVTQEKQ